MTTNGAVDLTFDPGLGDNDSVTAVDVVSITDPNLLQLTNLNGKIVIAGGFSMYNGESRNRIARLNSDGSLDTTFNPGSGANGPIRAIFVYEEGSLAGSTIIVGDFTLYGGINRNRIARLLPNGSLDTSFDPGTGANKPIHAVQVQLDGKVLIGGGIHLSWRRSAKSGGATDPQWRN